jgi:hypothetical protein
MSSMAEMPQDTDEEDYLCLDEFGQDTTILVPKPETKKLFVYSERECFVERVTLDGYVAYRWIRFRRQP